MYLKRLEIQGFKSFARKGVFSFDAPISSIVGPNGSGKSNIAEAIRFVLGEQSQKRMRSQRGEDLIWNGSGSTPRSNHASVAIAFDNSKKEFELDYDEVEIKRSVYRDGSNQYFINGTQVRLRDVIELLAKVHIGATGHHIISQGEADRILNANIKERRTMIEEALGLKIYQWKIEESEKKLAKTGENIKQVESLRREIAPHIRFLKKQAQKVQKAREMREELKEIYAEYLKRESEYIKHKKKEIARERLRPEQELEDTEKSIQRARETLSSSGGAGPKQQKLIALEEDIARARDKKGELSRTLGRIEGMIEYEQKRVEKAQADTDSHSVSYKEVNAFAASLIGFLDNAERENSTEKLRAVLAKMRAAIADFLSRTKSTAVSGGASGELDALKKQYAETKAALGSASASEETLQRQIRGLKQEIEQEKDSSREAEKNIFEMMARKSELAAALERVKNKEARVERRELDMKEEIKEGMALVGRDITLYENFAVDIADVVSEDEHIQENRKKHIEKIKILLEDMGAGGGEDIMKEYEEVVERDRFLEREIKDLHTSADSLRELIGELARKLDADFKEGVRKINMQFQEFFTLMFGGGSAGLVVVAQKKRKKRDTDLPLDDEMPDEEESEEGIDINVSLPRKKIKGLQMLSGGERALASIALIFAVSQVNPPPFLVLDETDAALDEANSRKYGDMLENLSKHSQLIVITHNRETMSRAGILYGVTMGSDAVSKLLSVKFDEAAAFAK